MNENGHGGQGPILSELVELFLAALDVARINLDESRESLFAFAAALAFLSAATLILLGGLATLMLGLHQGLSSALPAYGASLITGGVALVPAAVLYLLARKKAMAPLKPAPGEER